MAHDFRDAVFERVFQIVAQDPRSIVLTNDMGAMGLNHIQESFPRQVINGDHLPTTGFPSLP